MDFLFYSGSISFMVTVKIKLIYTVNRRIIVNYIYCRWSINFFMKTHTRIPLCLKLNVSFLIYLLHEGRELEVKER
jgi:hypothetical protein